MGRESAAESRFGGPPLGSLRRIALLLCLSTSAGCTLIKEAVHTTHYRASQSVRECLERRRNWRWAEQAWSQVVACQGLPPHGEYSEGFKEGFSEFLYRGGTGEPPLLPPPRFRHLKYQSPEGYEAIQDWFAGYRHGALVADRSGFRNLVVGPTSLQGSPSFAEPASIVPTTAAPTTHGPLNPIHLPGVSAAPSTSPAPSAIELGSPIEPLGAPRKTSASPAVTDEPAPASSAPMVPMPIDEAAFREPVPVSQPLRLTAPTWESPSTPAVVPVGFWISSESPTPVDDTERPIVRFDMPIVHDDAPFDVRAIPSSPASGAEPNLIRREGNHAR